MGVIAGLLDDLDFERLRSRDRLAPGPDDFKHFDLSADQWGTVATVVMLALAVLDIPGSIWSDRYGGGWKRARFQVPLVLGYTALSFLSGFKALVAAWPVSSPCALG